MADPKTLVGAVVTLAATAGSWVEQANAYGQLIVTAIGILVGILTVMYTWERIRKLRHERSDHEEERHVDDDSK